MDMPLRPRPPGINYADDDDDEELYDDFSDLDPDYQYDDWLDGGSEDVEPLGDEREAVAQDPVLAQRHTSPHLATRDALSPLSSLSPTPTPPSPPYRLMDSSTISPRMYSRQRSTPRVATRPPSVVLPSPRSRPLRPFPMLPPVTPPATTAPPLAHRISNGSGSSDSSAPVEVDPDSGTRRFTAQEKGKGRAIVRPIEVPDDVDENGLDDSIEILTVNPGEKRKRADGDEMGTEVEAGVAETGLEERGIGAYMCPVCFSAPEQAVITSCGHILCAKCLHDSLIAAIRRNPNPYPQAYPMYPGAPGRRGGRGARGGRGGRGAHATRGRARAEPVDWSWTAESLKSAWSEVQIKLYESNLEKKGVERVNWDLIKENDSNYPVEDRLVVKEELKGLWSIDGKDWVIEGECPVCRNQIPGGYAPPSSGLGGVIPLYVRVESGK